MLNIYNVRDDYIEFLKQYDFRVLDNKNGKRPYVGIVLKIRDVSYFAPLSSPKAKHRHMKNTKDFRKINNGRLGAFNFNKRAERIPLPLSKA